MPLSQWCAAALAALLPALAACDATPPAEPVDPQILAQVGDKDITVERLDRALKKLYPRGSKRPEEVERKVLQRLIDVELLIMAARDQGLDRHFQVETAVQQKEQELLLEELYQRGILKVSNQVTAEEARLYFERYHIGEERRLRRVLVDSYETANRILSRLQAGEDFAELASEESDDPKTASRGGDLGWKSRLALKSHLLRRQIFKAQTGDLIGPLQEPDGLSVLQVTDIRQVPFDPASAALERAVLEQKQALTTLRFLEDLANRADVREEEDALQLLFGRLIEAGMEMPELKKNEGSRVLLRLGDIQWTLDHFMRAMRSERDQVEIKDIEDLRNYARRLFALKILLIQRARELGLDQTENVRKGREKVLREALMDRIRQVEVKERINPSADEIRAYYEAHRDRYLRPERISILEVLVDTHEQAEDLLEEVAQGKDLEQLAKRYSMRSPRIRRAGGRVQLLRPDMYGKVGWEAKDAQVGEVVGPVESAQGYSVFKVLRKVPAYQQSFAKDKFRAAHHLRQDLAIQRFEELLQRLNQRYADRVKIHDEHFQAFLEGRKKV